MVIAGVVFVILIIVGLIVFLVARGTGQALLSAADFAAKQAGASTPSSAEAARP